MKLLLGFFLCLMLLLFTGACTHSKAIRFSAGHLNNPKFTIDSRDYIGKRSIIGLRLHISQNTILNLNIKSIADFIQPSDIDQNNTLSLDNIEIQPWALCEISF